MLLNCIIDPFTFILSTFSLSHHSRDLIALCKEDLTCKKLELLQKFAEACGFTDKYQQRLISKENAVSRRKRAPATDKRYQRAVDNWRM
jgi:hypothetical protein